MRQIAASTSDGNSTVPIALGRVGGGATQTACASRCSCNIAPPSLCHSPIDWSSSTKQLRFAPLAVPPIRPPWFLCRFSFNHARCPRRETCTPPAPPKLDDVSSADDLFHGDALDEGAPETFNGEPQSLDDLLHGKPQTRGRFGRRRVNRSLSSMVIEHVLKATETDQVTDDHETQAEPQQTNKKL